MAAYYTASQYASYLSDIKAELGSYGSGLALHQQYGHEPSFPREIKFMLLNAFVEIADWYLDEYDDPDDNGLTVAEFNDIQRHINKICNTEIFIVIE